MDITREVRYRGFLLNDPDMKQNVTSGGLGTGISGCVLESADISDVDVVQFLEKRSMQDGMDAGDVYLGSRRIRLSGTVYSLSRALMFDTRRELRAALSPVLAQYDEPADKGFQPLYWSEPTNRIDDFPGGTIDFRVLATPRSYQDVQQRDQLGGDDYDAVAMPWHATLLCRNPAIMGAEPQDYDLLGTGAQSIGLVNRGNFLAPLNMLISVGTGAGTIVINTCKVLNTITIPASSNSRIIRYKGMDKLLTVEENGSEVPHLDYLTFSTDTSHPLVPHSTFADPAPMTVTLSGVTAGAGSHVWFWEQYA